MERSPSHGPLRHVCTLHVQAAPVLEASILVELSGSEFCCGTPLDMIVGVIRMKVKTAAEVTLNVTLQQACFAPCYRGLPDY